MAKNNISNTKNNTNILGIMAVVLVVLFVGGAIWMFGTAQNTAVPTGSSGDNAVSQCDLTQKPTIQYNDIDALSLGTDPAGALYVITDYIGSISDDGSDSTHFGFYKDYEGLVEYGSSTYFAQELTFNTECDSVVSLNPKVYKASAPTLTILNSDAVTKNTDTNHEDVSASDVVEFTITAKAPTDACSSKYGALVVVEYDKTYVSKVESSLGGASETTNFFAFTTNQSGTGNDFDGKMVFKYDGELCDGAKTEFTIKTTQTDETSSEDTNNFKVYWYAINKDLDQDTLKVITGVEDEDNNEIHLGNTSSMVYTA